MAREVVDAVERSLGRRHAPARTSRLPLTGGELTDVAATIEAATAAVGDVRAATRLVHAHGDAWRDVWSLAEGDEILRQRVEPDRPYLLAELAYAVRHELALTLGDLLIRRIPLAFETRDNGRSAARRVASLVGGWLMWSASDVTDAIVRYDAEVDRMFRVEAR